MNKAYAKVKVQALAAIEDFKPDAEHINALPEPLRRHIRDLETKCNSAAQQIDELLRRIAELEAEVKAIQDGYLKSF